MTAGMEQCMIKIYGMSDSDCARETAEASGSSFIRRLHEKVEYIRQSEEEYMEYLDYGLKWQDHADEAREAGMKAGIEAGMRDGMEAGMKAGMEAGRQQQAEETAIRMKKDGLSAEQIAGYIGISLTEVRKIIA